MDRAGEAAVAWIALRSAPGIGDVAGRLLVERFGGAAAVLATPPDTLVAAGCPAEAAAALAAAEVRDAACAELARIVAADARVIPLDAPEYPSALREVHDAPLYLIARGGALDECPAIAVVGSRRATSYGREVARRLAEGLAHAGVTVVSGLARGVDGAAHEGALAARGRTVAVLGSGIDVVYPREHADLARRIVETGTLLSERPVGTMPLPGNFPARNRILAGMTRGTIVIEAAERSGSLITARLANECGREVFAVPGRVDSPLSFGAHLLIRQGATLVRDLDDVLAEIAPALRARAGDAPRTAGEAAPAADAATGRVVELLRNGPASIDELIAGVGSSAAETLAILLDLELQGAVRQVGNGQFQLTGRFAGVGGLQ